MKSIYIFQEASVPFLFHTLEKNDVIVSSEKKDSNPLPVEKQKEKDKEQKQRIDDALINKALEIVEFGKTSFAVMGKEESMLSTGIEDSFDFPQGFEKISASALLRRSPEELRTLFIDNEVVNFHGNNFAKRNIGAGDLFGPDQKFIKVNGVAGQRSIDSKFHGSKVGYVTREGNYLKITGGETISADVSETETIGFGKSVIENITKPDGTVVSGESIYKARFLEEVEISEEYEQLDWEEKVQKSDEVALNTKVDLSRLPSGNEQMARTIGRILAHKDEYLYIQSETGVPWMLVAAIHARESSNKFTTYLHNGEPLGKPTTLVPKGIFFGANQWKEAAVDAITRIKSSKNEFSSLTPDSGLGEMALFAEAYNGQGYRNRGLTSPYVYSGTDKYTSGKYVADNVFDASAVDKQLGVMPIILALRAYE